MSLLFALISGVFAGRGFRTIELRRYVNVAKLSPSVIWKLANDYYNDINRHDDPDPPYKSVNLHYPPTEPLILDILMAANQINIDEFVDKYQIIYPTAELPPHTLKKKCVNFYMQYRVIYQF